MDNRVVIRNKISGELWTIFPNQVVNATLFEVVDSVHNIQLKEKREAELEELWKIVPMRLCSNPKCRKIGVYDTISN